MPIVSRALGAALRARMLADLQGLSFAFHAVMYSLDGSPMRFRHLIMLLPRILAMRSCDVSTL